ncbi:hypothetical protein [Candidatus Nitronereus thalassa]|uniref:Uncharacterized protein n=1 Tax=Candidatus Nitronereus thalassa TaxID=3020898 RepID=A0ABU3K985_9BACT|nr:hypothetical protein [Candidatus Nitronereus thalassa]MDT7042924.1 hypothetical protein [Candidatus Nitronereus thalassa]
MCISGTPRLVNFFILGTFLILLTLDVSAETGPQSLDRFYAQEFRKVSDILNEHIHQLDRCEAEMTKFEEAEVIGDLAECKKYNVLYEKVPTIMNNHMILYDSYGKWLRTLTDDESIKESGPANSHAMSLLRIFDVKLRQGVLQAKRVQELGMSLSDNLKAFSQFLDGLVDRGGIEQGGSNSGEPSSPLTGSLQLEEEKFKRDPRFQKLSPVKQKEKLELFRRKLREEFENPDRAIMQD